MKLYLIKEKATGQCLFNFQTGKYRIYQTRATAQSYINQYISSYNNYEIIKFGEVKSE